MEIFIHHKNRVWHVIEHGDIAVGLFKDIIKLLSEGTEKSVYLPNLVNLALSGLNTHVSPTSGYALHLIFHGVQRSNH